MSPAPLAHPNALTSQGASLPGPMRRPSLSSSPPPSAAGPDVTSTSPPAAGSLVSIRPLPSPSLYQPAQVQATQTQASAARPPQREPSMTERPMNAYVPPLPPSSSVPPSIPASSASSVSSLGDCDSSNAHLPGSTTNGIKLKENTGRWLTEEHEVFLRGLDEHGKQWKKIAVMIKTRSVVQVRTHAQKYFQKLLKNDKKDDGIRPGGKERTSSIISASTAVSTAPSLSSAAAVGGTPIKRKSSSKGNNKAMSNKKRRVSLEPKPKKHHQLLAQYQYQPAPMVPQPPPHVTDASAVDHTVIDPSFMQSLNMAEGELDDSM